MFCATSSDVTSSIVVAILSAIVVAASDNNFVEYYVREELPVNELVGNLVRDFGLDQLHNPSELSQLRFTFLTQPAAVGVSDKPFFAIDERTGDIFVTSNRLDRDKICPRLEYCVLEFDVAVQPHPFFKIIKVKVEIMDDNDNAPVFPERKISHEISELAEPGTAFVVPAANDLDSGRNAVYRYDVVPRDGKFELTSRATADGGTDLRLVLRDRLDRETEDRFLVTVLAIDGGDPPKTGSILVNISVLDANDNNPQFDNTSYEVWVTENVPVGTVILRLKARDRDTGQNAAIVYEFSKHTAEEYGHLFGIKSETGKIYVKNGLDFETGSVYLLSVTASDRGPDSLPAHASVVVRVEDVNDHGPQISINTLTSSGIAEVRENSEIGTFVAHLSVVDADSADNGRFLCAVDDRHFALEQLYPSELKLVTAAVLDREQRESYDLSISCRDFGATPLSSVVPLWVKVADNNDHPPQFASPVYESRIEENNPIGVRLFHVTASDPDSGPNGQIIYRVDAESSPYVRVDPATGEVSAAASFDREIFDRLTIRLTAEDRGESARSAEIELRLTIIDTDDNGPVFDFPGGGGSGTPGGSTSGRYTMRIVENKPAASEVGAVTAVDRDLPPFDRFSYSPDRRRESFDVFEVDSLTGMITTKEMLDRERQAHYRLVVVARPDSGNAPSGTVIVDIEVDDVNDCDPVFKWPSPGNETLAISNRTPRGYVIARMRATDRDAGINANLTYYLVWSDSGGSGPTAAAPGTATSPRHTPFVVVPDTGSVVVAADLGAISMEAFLFRATVRDGGNRFSHAFLRIVVSKDVLFVPSTSSLTDGGVGIDGTGHFGLLASEDMVVVLAFTLAVIIVAIFVIIVVILALRRRGLDVEIPGVGGGGGSHRRPGPVWAGSLNGGRVSGGNEEKMQLSGTRGVYDVDHSCSNGTLTYCNGASSVVGNARTSTTIVGCGNGTRVNGYSKKVVTNGADSVANGNHVDGGSSRTKLLPVDAKEKPNMATPNKATAVVNAYTSFDQMGAYPDDDVESHVTCIGDRQSMVQGVCDVTANTSLSWMNDGHVMASHGCVPDVCAGRVLDAKSANHVKSSVTAADLNYGTMPSNFRTSWQSLPVQNDPARRPVVVFIRDQDELYKDNSARLVDSTSTDPFRPPIDDVRMMTLSSPAAGYPDHPLATTNSGHLPSYYSTMPRLAMTSSTRQQQRRAGVPEDADAASDYFQTTGYHGVASEYQRLPAPPPLTNSSGFGGAGQWSSSVTNSASLIDKGNVR